MSEPIQIGLKEVYDEVRGLRTELSAYTAQTTTRIALLERDVEDLKQDAGRSWKMRLTILSSAVALIGSFVTPMVVR